MPSVERRGAEISDHIDTMVDPKKQLGGTRRRKTDEVECCYLVQLV